MTVDFSNSFDTVTTWTYDYDNQRLGYDQAKVFALANKVSVKLVSQQMMPLTEADLRTTKTALFWLLSNRTFFSIWEFSQCWKFESTEYSQYMLDLHKPHADAEQSETIGSLNTRVESLQAQLIKFEHEANQIEVLQQQLAKIKAKNEAKNPAFNRVRASSVSNVFTPNLHDSSFEFDSTNQNYNPGNQTPPRQAPPPVTGTANPSAPVLDANSSTSEQIAALTMLCGQMLTNQLKMQTHPVPPPPRPVAALPPTRHAPGIKIYPVTWSTAKHGSLREYTDDIFRMWAISQGLNETESTMFFSYAFEKQIHRSHINYLARNDIGGPRYQKLEPLVEQIILQLKLNKECRSDIQTNFHNFKVCSKQSMDDEFLRCFNLRKQGWNTESEPVCVAECKFKFVLKLDRRNTLHSYIVHRSLLPVWIDCTDYYDITGQLRDVENQYFRKDFTSSSSQQNNQPTKMECNNIVCVPCSRHVDNISKSQTDNSSGQCNNIAAKKCKDPKCGKTFTPTRPKYLCCNMECFRSWKSIPTPDKPSFRKRKGPVNNASAQPPAPVPAPTAPVQTAVPQSQPQSTGTMNNVTGSPVTNNVSKIEDETYITPVHIFTNNCKPFVIKNSLYDTGASPSLMTVDTMKKARLAHLLRPDIQEAPKGGDGEPMRGYCGTVTIKMSMEDSIGYVTETFNKKILIFDTLNHDFIVGQDSMRIGTRCSLQYPTLNKILFNPTSRMMKKFNKLVAEKSRSQENNNISAPPASNDPFDENSTFYLNVPYSTFNNECFDRYQPHMQAFTEDFMNSAENSSANFNSSINSINTVKNPPDPPESDNKFPDNNSEEKHSSPLSNILTEGGMDGTLDTRNIKVSATKTIETNKGTMTVGEQLSDKMVNKFTKFVNNYEGDVFDNTTLGKTKQHCHPELKPDAKDHSTTPKYMPLNDFMKAEAKTLVDKMIDLGVLVECTEPANSTIFIVQKTSGKWRLICDLRRYNDRLANFIVHLPSPYELINKICQFEMFSYCDFPDAYFNVPLSDESIKSNPIIASVAGQAKNVKFLRMAQGLAPATAWFVNILNEIYAPAMDFVFNYLDDSVVGSINDEDVHFTQLLKFIKLTQDAGLKLSLAKSVFFAKDLTFLNYTVSNKSWALSANQKATINALNADNLTKQKRESLAAFIQHFNKFDTGVAFASRKIRDVNTSPESVKSYLDNIKRKLIDSPALSSVNFENDLHIFTDASQFDCSGMILQKKSKGGDFELVACFSRKFPAAVANKCIYEKELWTLHQVTKTFRYLFLGPHRKVFYQDNAAVLAAQKSKAPSLNCLFNTIQSTFSNVTFKFTPTEKNASDCFTRINAVNEIFLQTDAPRTMPPAFADKILKIHCNAACCSPDRIMETIRGFTEYRLIKRADVVEVLKKCPLCADIRNHKKPRKSSPGITVAKEVTCQETVFLDHKQIINRDRHQMMKVNHANDPNFNPGSDKQSCLTVFEPVSKLVWIFPVRSYSSENIKDALRTYFMQNGAPTNVVTDNALSFQALGSWLQSQYSSRLHCTSAYHPNSNLSERSHKEFEKVVKIYDSETQGYKFENWKDVLSRACVTMNSLRHELHKMSAYEIRFNRIQSDVEPIKFYPVGLEHRVKFERFSEKVDKIVKSKLKVVLPIFQKNQNVKVEFPQQLPRFGVITSTADHQFKMSVQVKFGKNKPISVSKNFICLPRNGSVQIQDNNLETDSPLEVTTPEAAPVPPVDPIPASTPSTAVTETDNPFSSFPEASVEANSPHETAPMNAPAPVAEAVDSRTARRNRRNAAR